ncbi:MAG: hypothetical protein KatS3mg105_1360 [Gemmatales bacterium]|nr:MAG: hypothetical protein KatS3mg105_1360 [Gemmatales bacterium]
MIPIYRAGWQLIKVRAVMIGSLVAFAASLYFGVELARTYGLNPADGGELASLPARLGMGGLVILLGATFAGGMWLYGRHYAARMAFDSARKQLHLETASFFWNDRHVIDVADLGSARYHDDLDWGGLDKVTASLSKRAVPQVDAPWVAVRIRGWRWPVIIDQQGVVLHPELMKRLFPTTKRARR